MIPFLMNLKPVTNLKSGCALVSGLWILDAGKRHPKI